MKISQEQHEATDYYHPGKSNGSHSRRCNLRMTKVFEEIEGQGSQLDQVVATVEQCLEGPVTVQIIQRSLRRRLR
jgi:hypothetical protein